MELGDRNTRRRRSTPELEDDMNVANWFDDSWTKGDNLNQAE